MLRIDVGMTDFNRHGCDLALRVTETSTGPSVARAKTGVVFFDYDLRKVQPVPEGFVALFGEAQSVSAGSR